MRFKVYWLAFGIAVIYLTITAYLYISAFFCSGLLCGLDAAFVLSYVTPSSLIPLALEFLFNFNADFTAIRLLEPLMLILNFLSLYYVIAYYESHLNSSSNVAKAAGRYSPENPFMRNIAVIIILLQALLILVLTVLDVVL